MKVLDIPSSGKRGQVVAFISPFGQCHRGYAVPKNTITERRSRVRSSFGTYARAWSRVLTQLQRDAWDVAGPNVKTAKRLTSGCLTGQLHFQSINTVRACVGLPTPLLLPPDPVVFSPNPVGKLDITNGEDGVRLFVNLSSPLAEDIMVYGQAPCSAGRRKRRRVAYLGLLSASAAGQAEITTLYTTRFGEPRPGEKVFIVTRQQKNGWQSYEHETSEIVPPRPPMTQAVAANVESRLEIGAPPPPPASQATATQPLPDPSVMYTGCTPVVQRIARPVTPDCRPIAAPAASRAQGSECRLRPAGDLHGDIGRGRDGLERAGGAEADLVLKLSAVSLSAAWASGQATDWLR